MPEASGDTSAASVLSWYCTDKTHLYSIGLFDRGVTVLSQQIRALNLVWALVESAAIPCASSSADSRSERSVPRVAIIGGGFAGLTFAAGLLAKRADVAITIFEQRDTLLPLQQGSDSRWLHPRIYDWPSVGSEANAAMLPLLNWTAARASDVVVQVLAEWASIVEAVPEYQSKLELYCNARHLQVRRANAGSHLRIEWVGERREPRDGGAPSGTGPSAEGLQGDFDFVVLALGFGPERDHALSYWRNETLAQPSLEQARALYLVSGQGDGAMIDLLRLRISQFRQDRILNELFAGMTSLLATCLELHGEYASGSEGGMFDALERLHVTHKDEFETVRNRLARRLRRDTDAVLRLKVKTFSELFEGGRVRLSFQNRLLVYLLYKCGGFAPTHIASDEVLMRQHGIPAERLIRRHGPNPKEYVKSVLSEELCALVVPSKSSGKALPMQSDELRWPGGYFGYPGSSDAFKALPDELKTRREYLPGATELLATAFCSNILGTLIGQHPAGDRLRVTLHRVAVFGSEEVLQQACEYTGTADAAGASSTAARVFPTGIATIGVAYKSQQIVRSLRDVDRHSLNSAMQQLHLNDASRKMSESVRFLLAIPVIALTSGSSQRVVAVVYVDSTADNFYVDDETLRMICAIASSFFDALQKQNTFKRIANAPMAGFSSSGLVPEPLPSSAAGRLELVSSVMPPQLKAPFYLNFDYADFIPVS